MTFGRACGTEAPVEWAARGPKNKHSPCGKKIMQIAEKIYRQRWAVRDLQLV